MSHFSTVKTKLANRECLVQALQDLKLNPQVHQTPQSLKGYYGGSQGQSAEIIVSHHKNPCRHRIQVESIKRTVRCDTR